LRASAVESRASGTTITGRTDAVVSALDVDGSQTVTDDTKVFFGSGDDDFSLRYDSSSGELVLRDETNGDDVATFAKADVAEFVDGTKIPDDEQTVFGTNDDFAIRYDATGDVLVVSDESNDVDLVEFAKNDVTEFLTGAKVGDDTKVWFGDGDDYSMRYDATGDVLVLRDEANGDDVAEFPKAAATEFFDGAKVGDDTKVVFGDDDDFALSYDSANDELVITDETNGDDVVRMPKADAATLADGALVPDDEKLYLGSGKDYSIRYDSATNILILEDESSGNRFEFQPDGDFEIDGDLNYTGTLSPSAVDATDVDADNVVVNLKHVLPEYADNANAVKEGSSIWRNDGSGPNTEGIYYYDGASIVGPLATGAGGSPSALSGLTIDTSKDWGGYSIENVGPNADDLPEAVDLDVATFESGRLADGWVGDRVNYTVQSTVVKSGGFALRCDNPSGEGAKTIHDYTGRTAYPQIGDTFEYYLYFTDADDISRTFFATQGDEGGIPDNGYQLQCRATNGQFMIMQNEGGTENTLASTPFDFSNNLNEWLQVVCEWSVDGQFEVALYAEDGTELATLSANDTTYDGGGVGVFNNNAVTSATVYVDEFKITRRTVGRSVHETQRGTTELGAGVLPAGGLHAGPHEAPENATRSVHAFAPVTDDATKGDEAEYHDLVVAGRPAGRYEYIHDGFGGAYAARYNAALGRLARINASIMWEVDGFSDVQGVKTADGGGHTYSVTGNPRRLAITTSGGANGVGGAETKALTDDRTLGSFRVTFVNVSYTENDPSNELRIGLSDAGPDGDFDGAGSSGFYYIKFADANERFKTVENGSTVSGQLIDDIDWSVNHNLTFEYDADDDEARMLLDGERLSKATESFTGGYPIRPAIQLEDGAAETLEIEQIIVEVI
jgi:archaellum component FlaF (FlaF/FlaG flagellin family)